MEPTRASGKIDRGALPPKPTRPSGGLLASVSYRAIDGFPRAVAVHHVLVFIRLLVER